jgi:hypothetical protein
MFDVIRIIKTMANRFPGISDHAIENDVKGFVLVSVTHKISNRLGLNVSSILLNQLLLSGNVQTFKLRLCHNAR